MNKDALLKDKDLKTICNMALSELLTYAPYALATTVKRLAAELHELKRGAQ